MEVLITNIEGNPSKNDVFCPKSEKCCFFFFFSACEIFGAYLNPTVAGIVVFARGFKSCFTLLTTVVGEQTPYKRL